MAPGAPGLAAAVACEHGGAGFHFRGRHDVRSHETSACGIVHQFQAWPEVCRSRSSFTAFFPDAAGHAGQQPARRQWRIADDVALWQTDGKRRSSSSFAGGPASDEASDGKSSEDKPAKEEEKSDEKPEKSDDKSSEETVENSATVIKRVNKDAAVIYKKLQKGQAGLPALRAQLDNAIVAKLKVMSPLCKEYMIRRTSLENGAGELCEAAQGRLNDADARDFDHLSSSTFPCAADDWDRGMKVKVNQPAAYCTLKKHQLRCTQRMNQMRLGAPAAGGPRGGSSMDDDIDTWCHPIFTMPAKPVKDELASGVPGEPEPKEDEAEEAEEAAEAAQKLATTS